MSFGDELSPRAIEGMQIAVEKIRALARLRAA
jgi:hypothetical protein